MKFKIRIIPIIITSIFAFIYIFVAARPLSKELQFIPEWTISASLAPTNVPSDSSIPFKIGQIVGYFTSEGKITTSKTFSLKASISDYYFAPYGLSDSVIPFYLPDGSLAGQIDCSGFPFIDDDRLFVFLPGGNSFSQFDSNGKKLWGYEGFMPVTAFSSSSSGTVAGFADGKVLTFNPDGSLLQEFIPGGSKYPVIFGVDISPDGKYIACLSGLEQQRIVLAHIETNHAVIKFFKYMETDQTQQSFVSFSKNGKWLFYSYSDGLGIVNCSDGKDFDLKMKGRLISLKETNIGGTFFVLTKENKDYHVYVVENYTHLSGSFSFTADSAFIQTDGDSLYVGKDLRISKISLERK